LKTALLATEMAYSFTPTASSWVKSGRGRRHHRKAIRRGARRPTAELEAATRAYIGAINADPKRFRWTRSADNILAAIKRGSAQVEIARTSELGH
jgi:hypothetical protein